MPNDNIALEPAATEMSPEVADALGIALSPKSEATPVKPEGTDEKPTAEKKTAEKKATDDVKPEGEDKKSKSKAKPADKPATPEAEGEDDAQPDEFTVAGKKYSSFDEAVAATNRISGDNARIKGDVNKLNQANSELKTNYEQTNKLLAEFQAANKAWSDWYQSGMKGAKPETAAVDTEAIVARTLDERERVRAQTTLNNQYKAELNEIFEESDFKEVSTIFKELVDEQPVGTTVAPKKLYARARSLYRDEQNAKLDDPNGLEQEANARAARIANKGKASKVTGGGGQRPATKPPTPDMSPEIADALRDYI